MKKTVIAGIVALAAALLPVGESHAAEHVKTFQPYEVMAEAITTTSDHMWMYRDYDQLGGIDWATAYASLQFANDCHIEAHMWQIPWPARIRVSSIQVQFPGMIHCNVLGLHAYGINTWSYWCIDRNHTRLNFPYQPGAFLNDNTDFAWVGYSGGCPSW